MAGGVKEKDLGWKRIKSALLGQPNSVRTGIQGPEAETVEKGSISNVRLAAVHEFGKTFMHPGGTPYLIGSDGMGVFLPKGDVRATGVTGPHSITIPERSFFRSTFDTNRKKYEKRLTQLAHDLIAGKGKGKKGGSGKKKRAVGLTMIGEEYRADIIDRVRGGKIKQDLSASTRRKRGESGPALWDTGQLMGSLTTVLEKKKKPVKK